MRLLKWMPFVAMLFAVSGAMAREVPIQDFFKDPQFTTVSLSPDGKHIAINVPQADRTLLAVVRVADQAIVGKFDYGENRHFRQVYWVNDNRLLFVVTFKTGRFDFETARGDHAADHLREVRDVAGRLRIEGRAVVDGGQGPVDVMAERFEEAADPLEFGDDMRRGAIVAPFVRQRDFQARRIAADQFAVGF